MRISHGLTSLASPHAVTIGNFDGLHRGHQAMLDKLRQEARTRGLPSCVLTFEPHPREFFAPEQAPTRLTSLGEKAALIAAAGIDRLHVLRFDDRLAALSAEEFVAGVLARTLDARYVLVGDDFRFGRGRGGDFSLLQALGPRLEFTAEALATVSVADRRASSTAVREALAAGNLEHAGSLLGRPYGITGRVIHGDNLGRQIGFPTANIQLRHNRPPLMGIFAVEVWGMGDRAHPGAASLGVRPTVHEGGRATLEVFIFDFQGDLYGRKLRVDFLKKIRDEEKFPDLPSLVAQIARDVDHAKHYFATR